MLEFSIEIKQLVEKLSVLLLKKNWKIVTAESCTGGGLAYTLTELPGSSAWFERGFVTYSNESKTELLGVPEAVITAYGAVSEETAKAMAQGALEHSHAQLAISITGIAGPQGGSEEKPVGTVCFGCAVEGGCWLETAYFSGDRAEIRRKATLSGLKFTLKCLSL